MDIRQDFLYYIQIRSKMIRRFFAEPPLYGAGFRVRGIGIRESMPQGFVNRPLGTGDWLLMCFHTPVRVDVAIDAPLLPKGSLWIWPPDVHQFYGRERRGFLHSWLHCEGTQVAQLSKMEAVERPLDASLEQPFLILLDGLFRELVERDAPDEVIANNLFENWLRELARVQHTPLSYVPERLRRVRAFIETHYAEPITLRQLAAMANWCPGHFTDRFTVAYGVAPINYLINLRLDQAAYLLKDINLTVTEVARRVGYDDVYYFSKLFKRRKGLNPGATRESSRT